MKLATIMYFVFYAFWLILSYYLLAYFFQLFFDWKISKYQFNIIHIWYVLVFLLFVMIGVFLIPNPEFANRVQHAIWWGFLMILLVYFSYVASGVKISKFQFFCISCMIATSFWVANELAESLFQWKDYFIFADTIDDTWFDLWANSVWALLWSTIFTYKIN